MFTVLAALPLDFQSLMGFVKSADVAAVLWLLLKGMVGVLLVMAVLLLVVVVLDKLTGRKKKQKNKKEKSA
ncbi:MAG: hypothetical protein LKE53_00435 [Oscillospiraceae bacterium]|jgi:hypothetical protein|nr:hypothetical protein [Oscillospiraceae bacterium]MDD3260933.1 hypothetical protein [Oscillospiraceae bacterium]